jgi:hypothetical protein
MAARGRTQAKKGKAAFDVAADDPAAEDVAVSYISCLKDYNAYHRAFDIDEAGAVLVRGTGHLAFAV